MKLPQSDPELGVLKPNELRGLCFVHLRQVRTSSAGCKGNKLFGQRCKVHRVIRSFCHIKIAHFELKRSGQLVRSINFFFSFFILRSKLYEAETRKNFPLKFTDSFAKIY